ncbi:MAG TPA: hypothetical protein VKT32_10185 [Chthonomonadaceae bacterium]|nr:hypothetical protein [Chthonomonadaceae bacterium]
MDAPFCEVIGCGAPATWALRAPYALLEDYLCDQHYQTLREQEPERAARYQLLEAEQGRQAAEHQFNGSPFGKMGMVLEVLIQALHDSEAPAPAPETRSQDPAPARPPLAGSEMHSWPPILREGSSGG